MGERVCARALCINAHLHMHIHYKMLTVIFGDEIIFNLKNVFMFSDFLQ